MFRKVLLLTALCALMGCANMNSIYRTFDISKGESPMVDVRQRAVLVAPHKTVTEQYDADNKLTGRIVSDKGMFVCAEPSPDAMASLAYELAAKGGVPETGNVEVGVAMNDSAAFTGLRTQSIQLLRDFGYRLCESRMSGAINDSQYDLLMRRFQKNTVALLAIEQLTGAIRTPPTALTSTGKAEVTKALSELRAEREKIEDEIGSLENDKASQEKSKESVLAKDKNADISEIVKKIQAIDNKIARLKGDIKMLDDAMVSIKSIIVEGKTEVTIKDDVMSGRRSDEHIQAVAGVVHDIVKNIVLSDDDKQICMSHLQTGIKNEFTDWCIKILNVRADAEKAYNEELQKNLNLKRSKLSAAKPADQPATEQDIDQQMKQLKESTKGPGIYMPQ